MMSDDVRKFARAILHGDEVHKEWLLEAAEAFIAGEPLPPPRDAKTDPDRIRLMHKGGR